MEKHMATGRGAIRQLSRRSTLHMLDGGQDPLAPKPVAPAVVAPVAAPVKPNAADNAMMAANLRDGVGAYNSTSYGAAPVAPVAPAAAPVAAVAPVVAPAKLIGDPGFSSGYMAEQAARNARVGQQPAQPKGSAAARSFGSSATGFSMAPPKAPVAAITPAAVAPAAAPIAPAVAATPPAVAPVAPVAAPVAGAVAPAVKPPTAPGPQDLVTFQDGGMFSSIKRAIGMGPTETVTEKFARQDAERTAKAKPAASAPRSSNTISNYADMSVMQRREKEAGMKEGGELKTGKGGAVPGKGRGDKINAKYEPGEFVVSNDMLDMAPGLREHLHELRTHALAKKGMTPQMADAKAVHKGAIRALNGLELDGEYDPLLKRTGVQQGQPSGAIRQAAERAAVVAEAPQVAAPSSQSGGAVFGLYPQLAGGKRTTYATDAKLKAGVVATGPATFEPALTPAPKAIVGGGSGVRLGATQDPRSASAAPEVLAATQADAPGASASPVAASSAGDAIMPGQDPNRVTLNGKSGTDVAGAPGVSKFVQNGKTLYSNVPGDNQSTSAVNTVPGMSQAPIDQTLTNPDGSRWSAQDNAVMAANLRDGIDPYTGTSRQQASSAPAAFDPGAAVRRLNDITSPEYEAMRRLKMAADPGRRPGESGRGARGRAQGAIAQMADFQNEVLGGSRQQANAQMADATTRRGQDQAAVAQGAVRKLAQDRLSLDATKAGQDAKGASLDNESKAGVLAAQKALAAAKTPAERLAAEDNLRALQGKYEKPVKGPTFYPGSRIKNVDGSETVTPAYVFDPSTSDAREVTPGQAKAASAHDIARLKANPKEVALFEQIYGVGTAKQYLGK